MATVINDRIDVRISKEQKELIKYASELLGFKSLSEFIIYCVNAEANKVISENSIVLNTIEDKKIFLETILNPPKPNDKLKEAQSFYNKLLEPNGFNNMRLKEEPQKE
ncbi:MAG: DUF1778 domain-containing protein [Flavobacterium sp. JAD_PAG50586_2]|nr:MAG: DUF1778 domain-containing protein [Flavobacterium sp. JAD_PAG50586_2]